MTELRHAMQSLIEHPPSAPAPIERVAAHAERFARRRRLQRGAMCIAFLAVFSVAGLVISEPGSAPEQVVLAEGPESAGYVAEQPGGYVATGTWRLTITRANEVIELASPSSPPCGATGAIQAGDEVRGSITGPNSSLRVGERFTCPGTLSEAVPMNP